MKGKTTKLKKIKTKSQLHFKAGVRTKKIPYSYWPNKVDIEMCVFPHLHERGFI